MKQLASAKPNQPTEELLAPRPLEPITVQKAPLWRRLLPFFFGLLLLGWVLRKTSLAELGAALRHTNYVAFFGFTLSMMLLYLAADSFATTYIYRRTVCPVRFREFFIIRGASYLPSMLNHNVGQAWLTYFLSRRYGAPLWRVAGATLLVYGTNLAGLVLLGLVALPFNPGLSWLGPTVGALLVGGLAYFALLKWGTRYLSRWQATAPLVEIGVLGHLKAILVRIPHVIALYLSTWLCFAFFGVWVPVEAALAYIPILMLVAALPLTPGAVGTRDALAMQLLAAFAPSEHGVAAIAAATLGWFIMLNLCAALISPPLMRRASRMLAEKRAAQPD